MSQDPGDVAAPGVPEGQPGSSRPGRTHDWDELPDVAGSAASTIRDVPPRLARYRATIDNLDAALVHLLAERFRCTQQVGELKAEMDLPPADPEREARQLERLRALAADSGLDPVFAEKFFAFILAEVIQHHEEIRAGAGRGATGGW